jgi:uncharacterized membrane protein YgcG
MATKGGSGTFFRPPGDDDVAPVIPLRQRLDKRSEASMPRKLPRERAAFDPELEPADIALQRRRPRRVAPGRARKAVARLHVRRPLAFTAMALAAVATAAVIAAAMVEPHPSAPVGARRTATDARRSTTALVETQMAEASADRTRHLLTRTTPRAGHAAVQHHRGRAPATNRREATTARHQAHHKRARMRSTTTTQSSGVTTSQSAALSGSITSSGSSGNSDSGSTGSSSVGSGSTAGQSPKLSPGPTGVGSASGCNPKCS